MGEQFSTQPDCKRILVVDDIELNQILTKAILNSAGYEVDCVGDGEAALRTLECKEYDLLLMDLDMPGLDGYQATSAIRSRDKEKTMPKIVALSARQGASDRERAQRVGMDAHLARPLDAADLLRAVRNFLVASPESHPQVLRHDVQHEIVSRIGVANVHLFLTSLLAQCDVARDIILAGEATHREIERQAHDLASTAGTLGYEEVWHRCREILLASGEMACAAATGRLPEAIARAMAKIQEQLAGVEARAA